MSSPSTPREDLRLDDYLEYPQCRKGTIHLQTSMPSKGVEPRSYSTAVSVTNHFTGYVIVVTLLQDFSRYRLIPGTFEFYLVWRNKNLLLIETYLCGKECSWQRSADPRGSLELSMESAKVCQLM
ncbi:hypothetical protein TNCV_1156681 [Trichonephila clavipes]|nr:hypothetical protein TNCV_1156681 [Trichonephila clavipes]